MIEESLKEEILKTLFQLLKPEECLVLLFGSEALGEAPPRIGIDCVKPIPDATFLTLQERLNEKVNTLRKIKLVELSELDEEFLMFALKGAVLWHVGRDYLRNRLRQREPSVS